MYANSFYAALNTRRSVRGRGTENDATTQKKRQVEHHLFPRMSTKGDKARNKKKICSYSLCYLSIESISAGEISQADNLVCIQKSLLI